MATFTRDALLRQLDIAWALTTYHLDGLTTDACLWRPATKGLHVHRTTDDTWTADWPDHEGYDIGPPSIGWITWHIGFWWSMVLDHTFGGATLTREQVKWAGSADQVRDLLTRLEREWRAKIAALSDDDLAADSRTRWPFQNRPFADVVSWLNVELMKNASEIGYARFLYAVRS